MANILEEQYLNLNNWTKNFNDKAIVENNYNNSINTLVLTGGGGIERFYIPLNVPTWSVCKFKFKFNSPTGFKIGTYGATESFAFACGTEPSDTAVALSRTLLGRSKGWNTTASNEAELYEIEFNSEGYSTIYIAFDFAYILDGESYTYNFSDFEFEYTTIDNCVKNGLILYYDASLNIGFNSYDASSLIWKDLSGHNYNGTLKGNNLIWDKDHLRFNGNSYVNVAPINPDKVSVEVIVLIDDYVGTTVIAGNPESGGYSLETTNNGNTIRGVVHINGSYKYAPSPNITQKKIKLHYVLTADKSTLKFYENGSLVNSVDASGSSITLPNNNTYFTLGANPGGPGIASSGWLKGEIYLVRLYNKALSEKEVYLNFKNSDIYTGVFNYPLTSSIETFIAPHTGTYKLEAWGAQGGNYSSYPGGYGGYSVGYINLNKNDTLYIGVGGAGSTLTSRYSTKAGGYNGGGWAANKDIYGSGSGGGATHIAKISGVLADLSESIDDILLVAGGGAGAYYYSGYSSLIYGNSGGGYHGGYSYNALNAGTQESGAAFGRGNISSDVSTSHNRAGGGGGFYGGISSWGEQGAGGGSGYIGNNLITNKYMVGYNVLTSNEENLKTLTTTNYSNYPTSDYPKAGNGFARITFIPTEKYLLKDKDNKVYTIINGALSELTDIIELTSSTFTTYGFDSLPTSDLLITLINPKLYMWSNDILLSYYLKAVTTGTPPIPQTMITQPYEIPATGIESISIVSSEDILFSISFDGGLSWLWYEPHGKDWFPTDNTTLGMTKDIVMNIPADEWYNVSGTATQYLIKFILPTIDSYVTSIVVDYINDTL